MSTKVPSWAPPIMRDTSEIPLFKIAAVTAAWACALFVTIYPVRIAIAQAVYLQGDEDDHFRLINIYLATPCLLGLQYLLAIIAVATCVAAKGWRYSTWPLVGLGIAIALAVAIVPRY